jgi:hypothetical protein
LKEKLEVVVNEVSSNNWNKVHGKKGKHKEVLLVTPFLFVTHLTN